MRGWLVKILFCISGISFLLILLSFNNLQSKDPPFKYDEYVEPLGDFQSVTIPLKRAGRLFLIEARIGDQTGNFVFDTGANKLVLNSTYFRKGLTPVEEPAGGITGNVEKVYQLRVVRFEMGGLCYENFMADVINLGHIENRRGVKILGLCGMSLFRNLEMVIDLKKSELQLYRIDREGRRINKTADTLKTDLKCPIKESGGVVFLKGTIGGKTLDFCLDTLLLVKALNGQADSILLADGWLWKKINNHTAELSKFLAPLAPKIPVVEKFVPPSRLFLMDDNWMHSSGQPEPEQATYGVNRFSGERFFTYSDSVARFFLPGHADAKQVYLSGTFIPGAPWKHR